MSTNTSISIAFRLCDAITNFTFKLTSNIMIFIIFISTLYLYFYPTVRSVQFSSVQFSLKVILDSLWPHESQHARPPCPSPTPRVYPNSCPSNRWCHLTISSSVIPFSSCPQSLPASGSFLMSQLFAWSSQSIGVSALASVLPMNTQDWSALGWTGWNSLQSNIYSQQ